MHRSDPDPDADGPIALWRWLRWYPLVLAAVAGVAWLTWPDDTGELADTREDPERGDITRPLPSAVDAEPGPDGPDIRERTAELLERGRDRIEAVEGAARRVAGAFGLRFSEGVSSLREHVGREELRAGGLKAARLTPFVGPFLRYQHARDLFETGEPDLQDQARRQTVIALAELSLDVGATGLGHAAAGSEGLMEAMEGVVQVADFADFALSLHGELGSPLGFAGLDKLDLKIDDLAGTALSEIGGLETFVDQLLTVEPPEWLADVPPELVAQARELLVELLHEDDDEEP